MRDLTSQEISGLEEAIRIAEQTSAYWREVTKVDPEKTREPLDAAVRLRDRIGGRFDER